MRIVFNTHRDDPGTRACITGLHGRLRARGIDVALNDWTHYDRYDVAVFMAYDHDAENARRANPRIRIGLADPKQMEASHVEAARIADFLIVTGVEQRDAFLRHNRNILPFSMFPPMKPVERVHVDKSPVIVGYHGNRVHLECMVDTVTPALNALARVRPLEFWAVYNIKALGQVRIGMPDSNVMTVRHIQWAPEAEPGTEASRTYYTDLQHVDIGIVPNALPIRDRLTALEATAHREPEFNYEPFDYLLRFKASSNAARAFPFAWLGIPVVGDFDPSSSQIIRHGVSGFVASSPHGWFEALDDLASSAELRNRLARNLRGAVDEQADRELTDFLELCEKPLKAGAVELAGATTVEDEQARLPQYPRREQVTGKRARVRRWVKRAVQGSSD